MRPIARYGFLGNVRKLLSQAAFFIDAKESGMGQTATNLGTAGSVLDAQYGSTTGADTNDPLLLEHDGTNYLYLPGSSGNTASTPDSAALDITGDLEIVLRTAQNVWTPSVNHYPIGKRATTGNQRSWLVENITTGAVGLYWSANGTTENSAVSTASVGFADGVVGWIKITLDVDNGASGRDIKFYTAPDQSTEPTSWTQLGTTVTQAGTTSIFSGTADLRLGGWQDGTSLIGAKYLRAIVRNGIGGTVVFDADFTTGITSGGQTTFTESSSNAATVTINRSTSGRKSVAVVRDVWLFGTDDYMEVADNDLLDFGASDSFTVVAVVRQWATFALDAVVAKKGGFGSASTGWTVYSSSSPYLRIADGTNQPESTSASSPSSGQLAVITGVRNVGSDALTTYLNGTPGASITDTTTATLANAEVMRVGRLSGASTSYADMELLGVAIFRRALSADELTSIANYYGAA